jgi:hypothetical protein
MIYDPTRVRCNGLHSGEEIEGLWALLRHIWLRLREMSASNRRDDLSEHLAFIARVMVEALGRKLTRQYFRAESTLTKQLISLKEFRKQTRSSDNQVTTWQQLYMTERKSQQPDFGRSMIERARLDLIACHDDAQYWIQVMRNHEDHNYKMRVTVSQHIAEKCKRRREALLAYNLTRTNIEPTSKHLTLAECEKNGHLNKLRGDQSSPDFCKHQHYDCLQVLERARDEIAYTKVETQSCLKFALAEIERFKVLEEACRSELDDSISRMFAIQTVKARQYLSKLLSELQPVITALQLNVESEIKASESGNNSFNFQDVLEQLEVMELPVENDDDEDWENVSSSEGESVVDQPEYE